MARFNDDQIILLMKYINEEKLFDHDIDEFELSKTFPIGCTIHIG
jgi:hypothetical protein